LTKSTQAPDEDTPCDLEAEMRTNPAAGGMVQAAAATMFEKSDRELASTLSTIRRHLNWLQYPAMRRSVEQGTGDLGSIQTTPTSLYVSLPVRHMSTCAGWQRMVLNCLLASFESGEARRAHQLQTGGHRTLIVIDEMPALGYMRSLEIAAGQIAGLGAKLYFCCQDLSQLKAINPNSYETFLANSGTLTFFSPQDTTTLEWIQRRLGDTTIVQHSQSEGSLRSLVEDGSSGRSASSGTHPLMTGAEAARVLRREDPLMRQLVISARHGPMLMQRVNYYEHPAFKDKLEAARDAAINANAKQGGAS
ncbi:MAG: type IV secretory system conjugative DNA transfer family protein, partial [Phycisphaerales bacterium]|nr:type IV secretory system conjugative DNA transfer family protein [Phycisphaerales bacterium]